MSSEDESGRIEDYGTAVQASLVVLLADNHKWMALKLLARHHEQLNEPTTIFHPTTTPAAKAKAEATDDSNYLQSLLTLTREAGASMQSDEIRFAFNDRIAEFTLPVSVEEGGAGDSVRPWPAYTMTVDLDSRDVNVALESDLRTVLNLIPYEMTPSERGSIELYTRVTTEGLMQAMVAGPLSVEQTADRSADDLVDVLMIEAALLNIGEGSQNDAREAGDQSETEMTASES